MGAIDYLMWRCEECRVSYFSSEYGVGELDQVYRRVINGRQYTLRLSVSHGTTYLWETGVENDLCRLPHLLQNVNPTNVIDKIKTLLLFS
jgi:hypothetical protein